MSDAQVAALMREMEIDIAIDLNGYTGTRAPAILAQSAATGAGELLGYPGTNGCGL